ncbi:hypothetical protein ACFQ1S_24535 [Kibdelosporangium lantanae]|uniref:Uncharacterized protein n=1 Tax=Kibdelosporangium lantanae TaxID=1497396 RepID=A0ABW3MFN8_9PSEU
MDAGGDDDTVDVTPTGEDDAVDDSGGGDDWVEEATEDVVLDVAVLLSVGVSGGQLAGWSGRPCRPP